MAVEGLTLVSNPGSASRKYALYDGSDCRGQLHFEYMDGKVIYTLSHGDIHKTEPTELSQVEQASQKVIDLFKECGALKPSESVKRIGLRVVAPGSFFLQDHVVDDNVVEQLKNLQPRAPLHIAATLQELAVLREHFVDTTIVGVSDSAFHATKPDYAWNYGINLDDADRLDIKRFGYHGLSASAAVHALKTSERLPTKLVVCHLGSGVSISAIYNGRSIDTTMGFSPLEGVIMATRSGTIDLTAANVLKDQLGLDDAGLADYLNNRGGLLGLSGRSSGVRELLQYEQEGDHRASLALQTYTHSIQKAIGHMMVILGGLDVLVFTGTVGERSAPLRERVLKPLHFTDITVDHTANDACTNPTQVTNIAKLAHSKPVFVVPTDEALQIALRAQAI